MAVEAQRLATRPTEEVGGKLQDAARRGKFIERGAGFVRGIQLENGIRPKSAALELLFDETVDLLVINADEAFYVVPLI